ncbi:MAG: hypothetical protein QNJ37_17665 [Crocosphaera sp.]|nr:hypothetical protein [Crocosphaera sp.]
MNQPFYSINKLREIKRELGYSLYDGFNSLLLWFRPQSIINESEIRLIGLKRTGNHGITNWIIKQYGDINLAYLNAVKPKYNPYRLYYNNFPNNRFSKDAFGQFSKKDLLFYSYEDWPLELICDANFEKKHDLYLGKSSQRYDILILRDPFNLFASRLKMMDEKLDGLKGMGNQLSDKQMIDRELQEKMIKRLIGQYSVDLWITYAKEFLGETDYLTQKKVFINYNQWFCDQAYRKNISQQLDVQFSDVGLEKVKGQGGGSSFDGKNLSGKASQMKVLQRWQHFQQDPRFVSIFENKQLWHYSDKIFGKIPGTESLLNQLSLST